MATFTVNIPDELIPQLITAVCNNYKYQAKILQNGILTDNPITPAQFTQNIFISFGKNIINSYAAEVAAEVARQQALENSKNALDNINIIIS